MTAHSQYKKGLDLLHLGHYLPGFRLYEFRWHPQTMQATGEKWDKWIKAPKWNGERLYDKHITVQMEVLETSFRWLDFCLCSRHGELEQSA